MTDDTLIVYRYDDLDIDVLNEDGTAFTLATGESLWFTVKARINGGTLITLTTTTSHIKTDMILLDCGEYISEIGVISADGSTETLAQMPLKVLPRLRGIST